MEKDYIIPTLHRDDYKQGRENVVMEGSFDSKRRTACQNSRCRGVACTDCAFHCDNYKKWKRQSITHRIRHVLV